MLKHFFIKYFPWLGKYKRFIVAFVNAAGSSKKTYSQHGEDMYVLKTLQMYDLSGSVYVDIGANHPTDISNTYLLYRNQLRGIIIEPNAELIKLFCWFRKKDTCLMIGCSNENAILKFNISRTPVVSSFSDDHSVNTHHSRYLPVMKIDDALKNLHFEYINFLSVDVEGLNYEVLQGGAKTLTKCLLVCIEFDSEKDKRNISELLENSFALLKIYGCNLIYINRSLSKQKLLQP